MAGIGIERVNYIALNAQDPVVNICTAKREDYQ
jgi:hypothetical protein